MNIEKMQFKWDVYLLTQFFNTPGYKITVSAYVFMGKNNISEEEFRLLNRVPNLYYIQHRKSDIYGFVARFLTPLYNNIQNKDMTDIFDICMSLKNSNINTKSNISKIDRDYVNNGLKKEIKQNNELKYAHKSIMSNTFKSGFDWHVCK